MPIVDYVTVQTVHCDFGCRMPVLITVTVTCRLFTPTLCPHIRLPPCYDYPACSTFHLPGSYHGYPVLCLHVLPVIPTFVPFYVGLRFQLRSVAGSGPYGGFPVTPPATPARFTCYDSTHHLILLRRARTADAWFCRSPTCTAPLRSARYHHMPRYLDFGLGSTAPAGCRSTGFCWCRLRTRAYVRSSNCLLRCWVGCTPVRCTPG